MDLANNYGLLVVEDAAQAMLASYKGRMLGAIGHYGCYSFHETKNYSMGEGGTLLLNSDIQIEKAEIIREKGTNRSKFFRGQVDKYTWVEYGSSYLPSDINAAYLWAQLESADIIWDDRMTSWKQYYMLLKPLEEMRKIELPIIPEECEHNAHMFYIKLNTLKERTALISYLKKKEILTVFHYLPLHASPAGRKYGLFRGTDNYTTKESERLLRLPMYYKLSKENIEYICNQIYRFFGIEF